MQHFLKSPSGAAWAGIVPAQFLEQILPAVHDALATPDVSFGRIALPSFTGDLESTRRRGIQF
jgi:hypothetical protein